MELKWSYALLIMVLLGCGSCLDWQGAGNWTSDNLTVLYNQINTVPSLISSMLLGTSAKNISDNLNALWDPSWNVVIVYYTDYNNYDSVMYGYGFREHWFWFNGYQISSGYMAFIIWKDYNCGKWFTYESDLYNTTYSATTYSSIVNNVTSASPNYQLSDIWSVAQSLPTNVIGADPTILQDPLGYTIVASQSSNVIFYSQMCVA